MQIRPSLEHGEPLLDKAGELQRPLCRFIVLHEALMFSFVCLFLAPEGAFFVPYVIFFVCCGIPVFFLETAMGQFTSEGGITCWRKVCPLFEGERSLFTSRELTTVILLHQLIDQPTTVSTCVLLFRYRLRNAGDRSSSQRVLHRDSRLGHLLPLQLLYHGAALGRLWTLLEHR